MGKTKKATSKSIVSKLKPSAKSTPEPKKVVESRLSRGQKKRMAKRAEFMERNEASRQALVLETTGPEATERGKGPRQAPAPERTAKPKGQAVTTNREKRRAVVGEAEHLKLVMENEGFKADPFAAIRAHLMNTVGR